MFVRFATKGPASHLLAAIEAAAACLALTIAPYYSIVSKAAVVDPDIWWHIAVGDWIIANRTLPRVGILSQHLERPWVAYSWGFDVTVSTVHRLYGLPGIVGFLIALQVLISFVFLLIVRDIAKSPWWSLLIAAASIYAFYVNPLRPVLFTLLFFTLELFIILDVERTRNDKRLLWMAPLFLFWANFHIQFVYGMFVLALYIATRLAASVPGRAEIGTAPRTRPLLIGALALALLSSCVGPNWALPYNVALDYATDLSEYRVIQELGAIDFRRPEHFAQLLLLMGACFAVGRCARIDLFRPLLLIATAVISFRAMRDSWFVSMASGLLIAEVVGWRTRHVMVDAIRRGPVRPAFQYAVAAGVALIVSFTLARRDGMSLPALAAVIDGVYPLRAAEYVERSNLKGPMYNDFNWGGFLILRLPEHPVAIDPRADLYDTALFARSLRTANAAQGWQQDPDVARANFIVIQRWFPLAAALANDGQFRLVYQDHIAAVFVRVG